MPMDVTDVTAWSAGAVEAFICDNFGAEIAKKFEGKVTNLS